VLDFYSRRIVGWTTSDRLKRDLVLRALRQAIAMRRPSPGLIHHSDRADRRFPMLIATSNFRVLRRPFESAQYCSDEYRRLVKDARMTASMSGKGNCYDNAMVETVFKTIKSELIWRTSFQTRRQAQTSIGHYINGFYNPVRRHSALGYQSQIAFEAEMAMTE
jgi:putative transposase